MLKQLQHKRFTAMNDKLSSPRCQWYVQESIAIIGSVNDDDIRPGCVHT
jgi:hypothetical protein